MIEVLMARNQEEARTRFPPWVLELIYKAVVWPL
jgi:hypothetical protein